MKSVRPLMPYIVVEAKAVLLYGGLSYRALPVLAFGWLKKKCSACRYCGSSIEIKKLKRKVQNELVLRFLL